jgi:hypothetical protein
MMMTLTRTSSLAPDQTSHFVSGTAMSNFDQTCEPY